MERLFQILAVILVGIAAFSLWQGNKDATFISAVFGAVSLLISIRFQVKERVKRRETERLEAERIEQEEIEKIRQGGNE